MSLMYAKANAFLNASSPANAIAFIISISTAASRTTTSPIAPTIDGQMREEAMDVVVAKIISLLILTVLSVLCGLLPLRLLIHTPQLFTRRRSSVDYFLCCLRLFSGGIYLATCFLHLMPDTRVKMAAVMLNLGSTTTYALPELLIMSGFYTVIFVEQIIQVLYVKVQESDVNRHHKRSTKPKAKSSSDCKPFPSTLDDDVNHSHRGGSEDDDEDDEYNNVLIDDEDDLSFKDQDSDRKSLDSVTQMKEGVLEQSLDAAKPGVVRNSTHLQNSSPHCNNVGGKHHPLQQQHFMNHSKPCSYSDLGNNVQKTITRSAFDALSKSPSCDIKPYQNCQPPVIHAQTQQISVLTSFKQNNHVQKYQSNHVNHHQQNHLPLKQQSHQEQLVNCRSPTSPPPQQSNVTFPQVQQALKQIAPLRDSPISRQGRQYPNVAQSSDDESTDDGDEENDEHNNACRVSVCVEGVSGTGGVNSIPVSGDTCQERDINSGTCNTGRDCEVAESCSFALTPSKEVSFDRISESSSVTQDNQVRRVVDELTRTDDSSRAHFRSIIYIMALSFHGIFEGMALGLQSMKSSAWSLCFAIVVHRCVLAFKLGMDLCRGDEKQGTTFLCIGMFTLISTLGIIIGILISSGASLYSDVTVPEAILQSLATGTIFYIVFFDILFKDLEGKEYMKRVSCSFVGFSLMAIVLAIIRS